MLPAVNVVIYISLLYITLPLGKHLSSDSNPQTKEKKNIQNNCTEKSGQIIEQLSNINQPAAMSSSVNHVPRFPLLKAYKIPHDHQHRFESLRKLRNFLEESMGRFQNGDGKQYVAVENFSQDDFDDFNEEIYRKSFLTIALTES